MRYSAVQASGASSVECSTQILSTSDTPGAPSVCKRDYLGKKKEMKTVSNTVTSPQICFVYTSFSAVSLHV